MADEAQVPAWSVTPPRDPEAIDTLVEALAESELDIRHTLRVLFNSDFFKEARFSKMKSPAEVVIGTLRVAGGSNFPSPGFGNLSRQAGYMGQEFLNPPSVEGWHTGAEWINSGSLMRRTNFLVETMSDTERPGVAAMVERIRQHGELTPEQLVEACLDMMGPVEVDDATRSELIEHASAGGPVRWNGANTNGASDSRVTEMLQLIASLRDYQFA